MNRRAILLLAGGAGTRLWPLSTDENPKQFLQIFEGESLMQRAWLRIRQIADPDSIFISTNERYRRLILEQLPEVCPQNILDEPARRNTAPAIAVSSALIAARLGDVTIGIFPSDHFIGSLQPFLETVDRAFLHAESSDDLVTIGIAPTEPNTGFGYLELGDELSPGVKRTLRYVEKPDLARAQQLIDAGHVWNGGMFLWRAKNFATALEETAPEIAILTRKIMSAHDPGERATLYEQMPSIAIDFAVMEKAKRVATASGDFDWSDVGSWSAVARLSSSAARGAIHLENADGVFVQSSFDKPVVVIGTSRIAVVDSPDGLLVVSLDESEKLSTVVKRIGKNQL